MKDSAFILSEDFKPDGKWWVSFWESFYEKHPDLREGDVA